MHFILILIQSVCNIMKECVPIWPRVSYVVCISHQIREPGTKSYQMGVCSLICVSLWVLGVKKFETHWTHRLIACVHIYERDQ